MFVKVVLIESPWTSLRPKAARFNSGGSKSYPQKSWDLEREAHTYLGGEGNADRCAGSKEIAERPGRDEQLFTAGDRLGLRAGGVEAEGRDVGEVVYRRG